MKSSDYRSSAKLLVTKTLWAHECDNTKRYCSQMFSH